MVIYNRTHFCFCSAPLFSANVDCSLSKISYCFDSFMNIKFGFRRFKRNYQTHCRLFKAQTTFILESFSYTFTLSVLVLYSYRPQLLWNINSPWLAVHSESSIMLTIWARNICLHFADVSIMLYSKQMMAFFKGFGVLLLKTKLFGRRPKLNWIHHPNFIPILDIRQVRAYLTKSHTQLYICICM